MSERPASIEESLNILFKEEEDKGAKRTEPIEKVMTDALKAAEESHRNG